MTGVYDIRAHHDIWPPSTRAGKSLSHQPAFLATRPVRTASHGFCCLRLAPSHTQFSTPPNSLSHPYSPALPFRSSLQPLDCQAPTNLHSFHTHPNLCTHRQHAHLQGMLPACAGLLLPARHYPALPVRLHDALRMRRTTRFSL
jgi:hypothetical protein